MGYLKPKKARLRLKHRQAAFDTNPVIREANSKSAGTFTRPGSLNK
jgi:hypothetical protein